MALRQAVLGMERASFFYGSARVFGGVSFLLDGARTALVGENGAGKSTLLKCLTGELELNGGQVIRSRGLRLGRLLGPRGDVGHDLLGHPVQQRQRPGHYCAGLVDVRHAGPDELGMVDDGPDDLAALLEIPGDPGEQGPHPEQVEREPRDEQNDVDDGQDDECGHVKTSPFRARGRGTGGAGGLQPGPPPCRRRPAG